MRWTKILVLISLLFTAGCAMGANIVDIYDLHSYVEASLEKDGYLIIRAMIVPNSYNVITKYHFCSERNDYYLTLLYEAGNKKPCSAIEYTAWGGIRVTIPRGNFNPKTDKLYYKDKEDKHEIVVGTKDSWRRYVEKKLKDSTRSSESKERALKDI